VGKCSVSVLPKVAQDNGGMEAGTILSGIMLVTIITTGLDVTGHTYPEAEHILRVEALFPVVFARSWYQASVQRTVFR
jgi:hypothetical protein